MLRTNFLQPRALGVGTSTQSQSDQPPPIPPMQVELHRDGSTWLAGRQLSDKELLDAAAQLQSAPVSIVLVGDGHERARLQARAEAADFATTSSPDVSRSSR